MCLEDRARARSQNLYRLCHLCLGTSGGSIYGTLFAYARTRTHQYTVCTRAGVYARRVRVKHTRTHARTHARTHTHITTARRAPPTAILSNTAVASTMLDVSAEIAGWGVTTPPIFHTLIAHGNLSLPVPVCCDGAAAPNADRHSVCRRASKVCIVPRHQD